MTQLDAAPTAKHIARIAARPVYSPVPEFRYRTKVLYRNSGKNIPAPGINRKGTQSLNRVPSGIAEISRLQTREGYAYMKL